MRVPASVPLSRRDVIPVIPPVWRDPADFISIWVVCVALAAGVSFYGRTPANSSAALPPCGFHLETAARRLLVAAIALRAQDGPRVSSRQRALGLLHHCRNKRRRFVMPVFSAVCRSSVSHRLVPSRRSMPKSASPTGPAICHRTRSHKALRHHAGEGK